MSQSTIPAGREGSLEAPTRHPLDWRNPDFLNEASLFKEMERVFDICHGCRRCVSGGLIARDGSLIEAPHSR